MHGSGAPARSNMRSRGGRTAQRDILLWYSYDEMSSIVFLVSVWSILPCHSCVTDVMPRLCGCIQRMKLDLCLPLKLCITIVTISTSDARHPLSILNFTVVT